MARRDKENRLFQITAYSGVASFVCLGIIISVYSISWVSIGSVFTIAVLLGFSGYSVLHFFRIAWYHLQRARRDAVREAALTELRESRNHAPLPIAPKQSFTDLARRSFDSWHTSL